MTIIDAIDKLFKPWFQGGSWENWFVWLRALFALEMSRGQIKVYKRHTKRSTLPQEAAKEAWLVVGRRGGKSLISALVAVYLACFRDYRAFLGPGEVATVMCIATDRRQARVVMRYIVGFFDNIPMLSQLVLNQTKESLDLSNRVVIEVHTASFRSTRGYTLAAAICDEIAFWRSEESSNPDIEIIGALRPGLTTIPGSLLLCISSPYARRGALWQAYQKHFGKDGDPVLVWRADTLSMNPSINPSIIEQAYEEDEAAASAEYGAEFRRDIESYIQRDAVEACVVEGQRELPYLSNIRYVGFVDPSGGASDSFTLAIACKRNDLGFLACVRETKPPFSPESVVSDYSKLLLSYKLSAVYGDRYAGEWPREQFRKHGIEYIASEKAKSDIYKDLLPLINSQKVELLDNPRLINQLCQLERKTARGGRDSIDHAPGSHDDVANAAAGALTQAALTWQRAPGDYGITI